MPPALIVSVILILITLTNHADAAQSSWMASGGRPPDAVPSPYMLVDTAEPEDPTLSAGVLTLSTSDDAETMYYRQSGAAVAPPDPWVIEFEMRHVAGTSSSALRAPSQVFVTTSPNVGLLFQIDADSIFLLADDATMGASAVVDTDDAFHTYRFEIAGTGAIDVYYDDVLTLQGATYGSAPAHGSERRVAFGMGSTLSQGTSEWRSFSHDGLATSTDGQININIAGTGANPMLPGESGGAPVVADDNWNNLGGTLVAAGPIDLVGGDGLPVPGATASWTATGLGLLNDGSAADDTHLRSSNYDASSYPVVDVTVSGVPFAAYDVYAYHEGGAPAGLSRVARFSIGSSANSRFARRPETFDYIESTATADTGPSTPVGNYVVFRGRTGSDFTLQAGGGSASDGTPRNRFFALQIVESTPATTTTTSTSSSSSSTTASSTTTSSASSSSTSSSSTTSSSITSTSTVTSSSTTMTTLAGTTVFPPGKKLQVKQKKSGAQRLQLLAKDAKIAAALPCEVDGELVIEAVGAGAPPRTFGLDAALWKPIRAPKPERGCKYRKGPIVATVQIKTGKALKIVANADDLGVPLATDPRPVRVEVRHGDRRSCFEFGGTKGSHKADKKLLAKNAGPATACPMVGSPTGALLR